LVAGKVTIIPIDDSIVYVNGVKLAGPLELKTGARVILGKNHVFRFNHPIQARQSRVLLSDMSDLPTGQYGVWLSLVYCMLTCGMKS